MTLLLVQYVFSHSVVKQVMLATYDALPGFFVESRVHEFAGNSPGPTCILHKNRPLIYKYQYSASD